MIISTRWLSKWLLSPNGKTVVAVVIGIYLIWKIYDSAIQDPTSAIFDPDYGFRNSYSSQREIEANAFIKAAVDTPRTFHREPEANPSICIGVPTLQRSAGVRYFRRAAGSLLEGLTAADRQDIFFIPLIAHLDPTKHAAYNEPWLARLSDQVLTYDSASPSAKAQLEHLERTEVTDHLKKSIFDYSYILSTCYNATSAPSILILEDDVLAARGWYRRTKSAIQALSRKSHALKAKSLYIRLFYTEKNFGWNKEDWKSYLFHSILFESLLAVALLVLRLRSRHRHPDRPRPRLLTLPGLILILTILSPLAILVFFLVGRLSNPLTTPLPRGLHQMNAYGCCSQALLYPREQIPQLLMLLEELMAQARPIAVDSAIERFADREGLVRWAVTPSVFQHVGTQSGKKNDVNLVTKWGRLRAENIWSFGFERETWD